MLLLLLLRREEEARDSEGEEMKMESRPPPLRVMEGREWVRFHEVSELLEGRTTVVG